MEHLLLFLEFCVKSIIRSLMYIFIPPTFVFNEIMEIHFAIKVSTVTDEEYLQELEGDLDVRDVRQVGVELGFLFVCSCYPVLP